MTPDYESGLDFGFCDQRGLGIFKVLTLFVSIAGWKLCGGTENYLDWRQGRRVGDRTNTSLGRRTIRVHVLHGDTENQRG